MLCSCNAKEEAHQEGLQTDQVRLGPQARNCGVAVDPEERPQAAEGRESGLGDRAPGQAARLEAPGGRISRPTLLHAAPNRPPVRLDSQPDNAQMNRSPGAPQRAPVLQTASAPDLSWQTQLDQGASWLLIRARAMRFQSGWRLSRTYPSTLSASVIFATNEFANIRSESCLTISYATKSEECYQTSASLRSVFDWMDCESRLSESK